MDGRYVCKLDETTQKKAQEELNEDPKNRQGAIDTFREWILHQKHFKCPTDDAFLLLFLRVRKFSQLEARKQLENFLTIQTKRSDWCKDLDPWDPGLQKMVKAGMMFKLPGTDKEGRKVIILRPGMMDVHNKVESLRSAVMMMYYAYMCDEGMLINGCVALIDYSNITMVHRTKMTSDDRKQLYTIWQKNMPSRLKGIHMYNSGILMEFVLSVVKLALSEKMKQRLVLHSDNLEGVYKYIPMEMLPREYLPDDYDGPSAGTISELADEVLADVKRPEIRERIKYLSSSQFTIDLSQKDGDVPQESFRKLNVD